MTEQTILVTDSTDGIEKAATPVLAFQGHRVLLHGRNREKGRAVTGQWRPESMIPDEGERGHRSGHPGSPRRNP